MEIKGKYSKGDKVYIADTNWNEKSISCPDCLGTFHWIVVFANGDAVEVACQTCKRAWEGPSGKIKIHTFEPKVEALTIGSIRFDDQDERPFSYMCNETGVGSGRVYYEEDMFSSYEEAHERAEQKNEEQMMKVAQNNYSKKFGGTKEIENSLSTWGFTRAQQLEKAQQFRNWAKISGIIKKKSKPLTN